MMASRTTPLMAPRTKIDWSASALICICGGKLPFSSGLTSFSRTLRMMSSVEAEPIFKMDIMMARFPSTCTMLV